MTLAVATIAVAALLRGSRGKLTTEEGFRRVFEDSPTGMVMANLDLEVLAANAAFAAFLGREIEDIVGQTVASYSEPSDMERSRACHEELLAGDIAHYSMDKRYVRADGSLVWGELTVSLLRDDRGRPLATYAQVQDISSRRQTVETLDRRARYNEAAAELGRIAAVAADVGELAERLAEVVAERPAAMLRPSPKATTTCRASPCTARRRGAVRASAGRCALARSPVWCSPPTARS